MTNNFINEFKTLSGKIYILAFLIAIVAFSFKIKDSIKNIEYKREVQISEIVGSFLLFIACLLKIPYFHSNNESLALIFIIIYAIGFLMTGILNLIAILR